MNKVLRILATVLLLILAVYLAGLFDAKNRAELWQMLKNPNWLWLLVSVLVGFLVNLSSAIKWWMLAKSGGLHVSAFRTWAYYMIGMFYNLILPTSVGGDVVRAYEMGKYTRNQAKALASVFVERYTGIIVLLLFSLIAVFINTWQFNLSMITFSLGAFSIALAIIGWLAFDQRSFGLVKRLFSGRHTFVDKILSKIESLQNAVIGYRKDKAALTWAFLNSIIFYILAILNVFTTAKIFSIDIDLNAVILATPVIMLLMNIPFSIGNHGIMEFAFTMTFEILGLGAILGLSTALMIRLKSFLDGAVGAILHPMYSTVTAQEIQTEKAHQ